MTFRPAVEAGEIYRQMESSRAKLDELAKELLSKGPRLTELQALVADLERQTSTTKTEHDSLATRIKAASGPDRMRLFEKIRELESQFRQKQAQRNAFAKEHNLLLDELRRLTSQYEECRAQYDSHVNRLREFTASLKASLEERWEKTTSSYDNDTQLMQTDFFSGVIGTTDQKRKVHVAINEMGDVVFVRDEDGTVLYDKKRGIGHLPHDLNWSRD